MPRPRQPKGLTRVSYEVIHQDTIIGQPIYKLRDELVDAHHEELKHAKIALAWCTSWRPDVDGRVVIGKCKRASELDRELTGATYDFVILLSKSFWQDLRVTAAQRAALLDHELCHAAVKLDERTGDPAVNERRRVIYRLRKHDVEEFSAVIRRHGTYKRDLEDFAAALRQADLRESFTPCEACRDTGSPGYTAVLEDGVPRVTRCGCWVAFQERKAAAA